MKKNILLLINGFGIEQHDSISIYSPELMPNMDRITHERVFISCPNNYMDYKSAYRNFSMGINDSLTYNLIENHMNSAEYTSNQLLKYLENELKKVEGSKLHVVCFWDSVKTIEQIATYIREIKENVSSKIIIHVVLCQKSLNDYKTIERGLNTLGYELGTNVKIGIITGEDSLNDSAQLKEIVKSFMTEFGEKYKDLNKKFEAQAQSKVKPSETRSFAVSYDYRLDPHDQVLFFNYNSVDINKLKKETEMQKYRPFDLSTIQCYSLFPLTCEVQIPFMYNFAISAQNALNSLKNIAARCLIYDTTEKCPIINYYMTGLKNEISENIKFIPTDNGFIYDKNQILNNVMSQDKELIIINYELDTCKTVEEISQRLRMIDDVIGVLDYYVRQNHIALFITSFYGLEKELYNEKHEICKINFSTKVPLIMDDESINLSEVTIDDGNLFDLSNTLFNNINKDFKVEGMIKKKKRFFSFLYKKPKEKK